jgi:hypothetical protein
MTLGNIVRNGIHATEANKLSTWSSNGIYIPGTNRKGLGNVSEWRIYHPNIVKKYYVRMQGTVGTSEFPVLCLKRLRGRIISLQSN